LVRIRLRGLWLSARGGLAAERQKIAEGASGPGLALDPSP
jgi:hypothetical protein